MNYVTTWNEWVEQIPLLEIFIKGLIIGVVVSAPLGPVGVLCIQRTLNKGRAYGFVTGLGAALSDILYAVFTGYGISLIPGLSDLLKDTHNMVYLQYFGSAMLLAFGIYTFRSNPVRAIRPVSTNKGTLLHNFVTAFFVTLSNPLIVFLYIGLFARFSFVMPEFPAYMQAGIYLSIICGAVCWWLGITYFVNKIRNQFNLRGIWILNRVIGSIVIVISILGVFLTFFGLSLHE